MCQYMKLQAVGKQPDCLIQLLKFASCDKTQLNHYNPTNAHSSFIQHHTQSSLWQINIYFRKIKYHVRFRENKWITSQKNKTYK